jgi:hypothetical protein
MPEYHRGMAYTLYQKTHLVTGKKYLGWTKNNPHTYSGSGTYWKAHLAKHGKNLVRTKIIYQSENKKIVAAMGKILSHRWGIVESKEWANLTPEEGQGGNTGNHAIQKKRWSEKTAYCQWCETHNYPQVHAQWHGIYCKSNPNGVSRPPKKTYQKYKCKKPTTKISCLHCLAETDTANFHKYHNNGVCEKRRLNKNRFKFKCQHCGIQLSKAEKKRHQITCQRRKNVT